MKRCLAGLLRAWINRHSRLLNECWRCGDLSGVPPAVIDHLAQLTRRYDVQALKRFAPETRTAMLVCFLVEAHKSLLDHLIAMHEQRIEDLLRRSIAKPTSRERSGRSADTSRAPNGSIRLYWPP